MVADAAATVEHPLRSKNNVPRSDVRRATIGVAEALDAMLAAHTAAAEAGKSTDAETPEKTRVIEELMRCLGGRVNIQALVVGDVLAQIVCEDEAGAAAISAVINHTGLAGKASWFKGEDESPWIVLIVPSR